MGVGIGYSICRLIGENSRIYWKQWRDGRYDRANEEGKRIHPAVETLKILKEVRVLREYITCI